MSAPDASVTYDLALAGVILSALAFIISVLVGVCWLTGMNSPLVTPVDRTSSNMREGMVTDIPWEHGRNKAPTRIPRTIHFIWGLWDTGPIPDAVSQTIQQWRDTHPAYLIKLWRREACEQLLDRYYPHMRAFYDAVPRPVMRADLMRYLIVHREGGWYLDVDCRPQCKGALDRWKSTADLVTFVETEVSPERAAVIGQTEPIRQGVPERAGERIANYAFGAAREHPLWPILCTQMEKRWQTYCASHTTTTTIKPAEMRPYDVLYLTGPDLMTQTYFDSYASIQHSAHLVPLSEADETLRHHADHTWIASDEEAHV
jgi:Glycosyltransferase sugar-binding region containing DXD motif